MPNSTLTERERARIPKGNVRKLREWFLAVATESSPQLQSVRGSVHSSSSNQPPAANDRVRSKTTVHLPSPPCEAMVTSPTNVSQNTIVALDDNPKTTVVVKAVKDALELNNDTSKPHLATVESGNSPKDDNISSGNQSSGADAGTGQIHKALESAKCTSNETLVGVSTGGQSKPSIKSTSTNVVVLHPLGPSEARDRARRRRYLLDGSVLHKPKLAPHIKTDRRDPTPSQGWVRGTTPDMLAKIMTAHDNMQLEMLLTSAISKKDQEKFKKQGYDRFGEWPPTTADHYLQRMRKFLTRSDHAVSVVQYYIDKPEHFDERSRIAHYERWVRVAEYLVALNNMHSFVAVVTALQLSPWFRRRHDIMTKHDNAALDRLLEIANPSGNFAQIRLRQGPFPIPPPANMDLCLPAGVLTLLHPNSNLTPFVLPWIQELEAAQAAQELGLPGADKRAQDVLDGIKATLAARILYTSTGMNVMIQEYFFRQGHQLTLYDPEWNWVPPSKRGANEGAASAHSSKVSGS